MAQKCLGLVVVGGDGGAAAGFGCLLCCCLDIEAPLTVGPSFFRELDTSHGRVTDAAKVVSDSPRQARQPQEYLKRKTCSVTKHQSKQAYAYDDPNFRAQLNDKSHSPRL